MNTTKSVPDGIIILPEYLLQWMIFPIFEAQEKTPDDTTSGSAELDMYAYTLEAIQKAFPHQDLQELRQKWWNMNHPVVEDPDVKT